MTLPLQETLKELIDYYPETGELIWRIRTDDLKWSKRWAGKPALDGLDKYGYKRGKLLGKYALSHRIAWKWVIGEDPEHIDHINGDKSDNRFCNLRSVTRSENMQNRKKHTNNKTGVTGVYWHSNHKRWVAAISTGGRRRTIGYFKTIDEAKEARAKAEEEYGFVNLRRRAV